MSSEKPKKTSPAWLTHLLKSGLGGVLAMVFIRMRPLYSQLCQLEAKNLWEYWQAGKSEDKKLPWWVPPGSTRPLMWMFRLLLRGWVAIVCYAVAIYRMACLSPLARQDYYALLRVGSYALSTKAMEEQDAEQLLNHEAAKASQTMQQVLPVLIVPGLNTPASFFREMASFLRRCGFPVQIAGLPENGLADIESSAEAVHRQIEELKQEFSVKQVVVVGHCMGGMITKYLLDNWETYAKTSAQPLENPVRALITLGTGYTGAEGVSVLKRFWQERHPGQLAPAIFDQLLQWNLSLVRSTADIAYHSLLTVWDMMVRLPNGLLKAAEGQPATQVVNHVINDPAIDHLTLALNPKSLKLIESLIREASDPPASNSGGGETKPSFS